MLPVECPPGASSYSTKGPDDMGPHDGCCLEFKTTNDFRRVCHTTTPPLEKHRFNGDGAHPVCYESAEYAGARALLGMEIRPLGHCNRQDMRWCKRMVGEHGTVDVYAHFPFAADGICAEGSDALESGEVLHTQ